MKAKQYEGTAGLPADSTAASGVDFLSAAMEGKTLKHRNSN